MVKFLYLILVIVFIVAIKDINCSSSIADTLSRYYESELQKSFKRAWQKYKIPYEHALTTTLKENVGVFPMNIYLRHDTNPLFISAGCYFTDNVVDVLLFGLTLRDMPHLIMPEVTLAPASNLLRLEASLSKIFIDTHYYVARNDSSIIQLNRMEPPEKYSPFSLEQVQRLGSLTIIAEDCFLSGFSIVTLAGTSLNIGHSPMRISDCKFSIEVSSNDMSTPPVIAPYFPKRPAKLIESLLTKAFLSVLVPKIQGTVYTFVNTSDTFGDDLSKYRFHQQKLFKQTANYMSDVCVKLNNLTLQESKGHIRMSSLSERYEMVTDSVVSSIEIILDEMMLYGLDTAYATRTGGSFEATRLSIADAIRFSSMQIRGKSKYINSSQTDLHDFAAELTDVTVNVVLNMDKHGSRVAHKFEFVGWRTLDFSILPWHVETKIRVWYQSLVTSYILNEIPERIIEHLSSVLTPAANETDESGEKAESPGNTAFEKDDDGDQNSQDEDDNTNNNGYSDKNEDIKDENSGNDNDSNDIKDNDENENYDDTNNKNTENDNEESDNDISDDEKKDSDFNSDTKNILIFDSDENDKDSGNNEKTNKINNDSDKPSENDDLDIDQDKSNDNEEGDTNDGDEKKDSNSDSNTQNSTDNNNEKDNGEDNTEEGHHNDSMEEDNNNDEQEKKSNSNSSTQNGTINILVTGSDNNKEDNDVDKLKGDSNGNIEKNKSDDDSDTETTETEEDTNDNDNADNGVTSDPDVVISENSDDDSDTETTSSEIEEDKNDNDNADNGVTSHPEFAMVGGNDSKEYNYDDIGNGMNIKNVLITGNGDTQLAARKGKERNNVEVHVNNTRLGMKNNTLKGLSLKKLRSNNVRLTLTKNFNIARNNSMKKSIKMKMTSPHMSENELIR